MTDDDRLMVWIVSAFMAIVTLLTAFVLLVAKLP
jgi:hypothetical protein